LGEFSLKGFLSFFFSLVVAKPLGKNFSQGVFSFHFVKKKKKEKKISL